MAVSPEPEKNPSNSQICQVCGIRFAETKKGEEKEKNKIPLCKICNNRKVDRLKEWYAKRNNETIWLDELQDKNSRIALLTIRFELNQWLNGNMLSSCVNRQEKYEEEVKNLKKIIISIRNCQRDFEQEQQKKNLMKFMTFYENNKNNKNQIEQYLNLFDKKGVKKQFNDVITLNEEKLNDNNNGTVNLLNRYWEIFFEDNFSKLKEKKIQDNKILNKKDKIVLDKLELKLDKNSYSLFKNYYQAERSKLTFQDIFAYSFLTNNIIGGLILDRSNGTAWQKLIKEKIGIKDSIDWANLTDKQIDTISSILIQFLLWKNPSPARLRRIWESTQRFTEEVKNEITKEFSAKRIVWNVKNWNKSYQDKECEINGMLFYLYEGKAFLITSLSKCFKQIYNFKMGTSKNYLDWLRNSNYEINEFQLPPKLEIDNKEIEISNP